MRNIDQPSDRWTNGIPVLRSRFEEMTEEYYDYEFAFYFDGSATWGTMDPEHPMTEEDLTSPGILTHFTKEDADRIRAILDRPARLTDSMSDAEVSAIVNEEISALSGGVSTPAECAKKIQSRVSIRLAERG